MQHLFTLLAVLFGLLTHTSLYAADKPPNILVIFGDDVGWMNVSSFGGDIMGVKTPNIDRLAKEGLKLTSFYAQPSCTAGRAAFITGQLPVRTGLTTVGTTGSPAGLQKEDITLAEILKAKGYATASSARIILATWKNTCHIGMGSMNFGAISTISMATKTLKTRIVPPIPSFARSLTHAASCQARPRVRPRMKAR